MFNDVHRGSHSTDSTANDPFYSARSSMEDEEMLDVTGAQFSNYDVLSEQAINSLHNVLHLDAINTLHTSTKTSPRSPTSPPNLSSSSFHAAQDIDTTTYQELMRKVWISPPDMPINVIKYSIGRRELAMQTQIDQPFDLVEPDPFCHPPSHTAETESLKAWHKIVTRTPRCLPHRTDEPTMPKVKLAYGPLGWDQVWAYEYISLERILRNANYKTWWLRHSCDHLIWCGMHDSVEFYGIEVRFPYGYDATNTTSSSTAKQRFTKEKTIRIPANEPVLVPLGKSIVEWAEQISILYDYSEDGPTLPYPFSSDEYVQPPFTLTLRFKNNHPDVPLLSSTNIEDKGRWTKGWLSTDEVTILSGETDTTYLNTVINGGCKPNPTLSNEANRHRVLRFWGLDVVCPDMIEYLVGQNWMWERFQVDARQRDAEDMLRAMVRNKIHESLMRAIRDLPF